MRSGTNYGERNRYTLHSFWMSARFMASRASLPNAGLIAMGWWRSWFKCKTDNKANQTTRRHMISVHSSSSCPPRAGAGSIKRPHSQRRFLLISTSCRPTSSHRSPNTTPPRALPHSPPEISPILHTAPAGSSYETRFTMSPTFYS